MLGRSIGVIAAWGLVASQLGACEPPAAPTAPAPPQVVVAPTVGTPDEMESEDTLPAGHYRGVAGIRPMEAGDSCRERYQPVDGVCAHERMIAMQTEADLAKSIERYKRGITPQIVADMPAPPSREPGEMDPGALVYTGPPREKKDKDTPEGEGGDQTVNGLTLDELMAAVAARKGASDKASEKEEGEPSELGLLGRNFQTLRDRERVEEMDGQLRELGKHMDVLKDIQAATKDGAVDEEELTALLKPLEGTQSEALVKQLLQVYLKDGLKGVPLEP